MKKLFISQPMIDKTDKQIKLERTKALIAATKKLGEPVKLIDSFIEANPPEGSNPGLWYLGKSFIKLSKADIAYFVSGWENYRGCRMEYKAAVAYDIPIIKEEE